MVYVIILLDCFISIFKIIIILEPQIGNYILKNKIFRETTNAEFLWFISQCILCGNEILHFLILLSKIWIIWICKLELLIFLPENSNYLWSVWRQMAKPISNFIWNCKLSLLSSNFLCNSKMVSILSPQTTTKNLFHLNSKISSLFQSEE
jgi:hypothetical protein